MKSSTPISEKMKKDAFYQGGTELSRPIPNTAKEAKSIKSENTMDPLCRTGKNVAAAGTALFLSSMEEDIYMHNQVDMEKCSFDDDCMWLSSDSSSPSAFFPDFISLPVFHLSIDERLISEVSPSTSNVTTPAEVRGGDFSPESASLDAADLEEFNTEEPLFWPSERKLDWSSEETWECFSMSPRKTAVKLATPEGTTCKSSSRAKFHKKLDSKQSSRRRLMFNSVSSSTKTNSNESELEERNSSNCIKRVNYMQSEPEKSNKDSMKIVPLKMNENNGKAASPALNMKDNDFIEDDLSSNIVLLPIETLLGLGEFDGREGVDSEYNKDGFSLNDYL